LGAFFWFSGLYKNWYVRSPFDEFFTILRVTFFRQLHYLFYLVARQRKQRTPNAFFTVFCNLQLHSYFGTLLCKSDAKSPERQRNNCNTRIIVGTLEKTKELYSQILASTNWGYKTLGIILTDKMDKGKRRREKGNSL